MGRLNIVHEPVEFHLLAAQRFIAGNGKVFELDEHRVVAFDLEAHHILIERLRRTDIAHVFEGKSESRLHVSNLRSHRTAGAGGSGGVTQKLLTAV